MFAEAVTAAEELGFESVWFPEHLVLPVDMAGSPFAGSEHSPIPPSTPVYDVLSYLSYFAGRTRRLRMGTHIYNLALRHPFVAARAVQTADIVSEGRLELGVGAGWLQSEWEAAGVGFESRGSRLDEALEVCRRLWTEERVEHHGRFFDFPPVMFEPKPVQKPHPPVLIGGESLPALRRAARHDGWIGLNHTAQTVRAPVATLADLRARMGATAPFSVTVGGTVSDSADIDAFGSAGVHRLIVSPWTRTREVPESLRVFAARFIG
jgi:probable F420-dependent oxidoreductase